jgi:hypothetical protein
MKLALKYGIAVSVIIAACAGCLINRDRRSN